MHDAPAVCGIKAQTGTVSIKNSDVTLTATGQGDEETPGAGIFAGNIVLSGETNNVKVTASENTLYAAKYLDGPDGGGKISVSGGLVTLATGEGGGYAVNSTAAPEISGGKVAIDQGASPKASLFAINPSLTNTETVTRGNADFTGTYITIEPKGQNVLR
ncbi:MAG TPA: hypothetical protein PLN48_05800 [Lachnospiraceae bacterium]|nr:hypothetical protein [Lachnospiraceae bacterium]